MKLTRMTAWILALMLLFTFQTAALAEIWQKGDTGETVKIIQTKLIELGYLNKEADGRYDEATENAVMAFQRRHRLLASGMVDDITRTLLFSEEAMTAQSYENEFLDMCYEEAPVLGMMPSSMPMATSMPGLTSFSESGKAGWNTTEYTYFQENGFQNVSTAPLSTFAADVDTASYAQLRSLILAGEDVPADAVRIEEMLNYFRYDYRQPNEDEPFGVTMHLAPCPWNPDTLLLQIGLQASTVTSENRPPHNLVFLIDVSGSMFGADRLDLVKRAFLMLLDELAPTDTVSIVTYASRDEIVLEGEPAAHKVRIMEAINGLEAHGSTNSAAGIQTAYQIAERYAVQGGVNRVIMATDGDFNVGVTSEGELARLIMEKKQKGIRLTMLGVGYGNYKDNKLEALADYGDGNYAYLDTIYEARRALVTEAGGTFVEVAHDVKLQVDFNPAIVKGYRLIGYEDRLMAANDFADDSKDGGEVGSGHRVTVLYEIVPIDSAMEIGGAESRYRAAVNNAESSSEWLTLSIRAKKPDRDISEVWTYPLTGEPSEEMPENMRFAAAVAETGMLLRGSSYCGNATWSDALNMARSCPGVTGDPYKEEFVYLLTLLERQH